MTCFSFRVLPAGLLVVSGMLLVACGNSDEVQAQKALAKSLSSFVMPATSAPVPALSRAELAQFNTPMIVAEVPEKALRFYMAPVAENGAVVTWSTSNDITFSFRSDVLAATRGLAADVIESSTPSARALLSGQSGQRSAGYLGATDQISKVSYDCSVTVVGPMMITVLEKQHLTTKVQESCVADGGKIVNEYWIEADGKVRKSKEFLSDDLGYAVIERIFDR